MNSDYKKPFFIRHLFSVTLITVFLFTFSYLILDIPLAKAVKTAPTYLILIATKITYLIEPHVNFLLWPLLFFIARWIKAPQKLVTFLLLLVIAIPLSNVVNEIPKYILGRARPELLFSEGIFGFTFFKWNNAYQSCPSGHSCTTGAFFGILSCYYPKRIALFLTLALVCAFSRVILEDHYLSDILAGVILGSVVSQSVYCVIMDPFHN